MTAPDQTGFEADQGSVDGPLRQGFFAHKERAFWILQLAGWSAYGSLRFFNGLAGGFSFEYWKPSVIASVVGLLLSLIYRHILRPIRGRSIQVMVSRVIPTSVFFALIFSAIETIGHVKTYRPGWEPTVVELFGNTAMDFYVLTSWAALYLIINYSLLIQEEREKALSAINMAHQAQLKMLRYQLNPHFLFNTLNAISSLVLTKKYENANGMLGKLSSFLRYSLVNQPTQKTTLEQELHALRLYLDIEKVRFQKRLKVHFEVEKKAKAALMPSLLLQPLVENAVKYAIAPSERGGEIFISGAVRDGRLELAVRDDGPGIREKSEIQESQSSGVGIANIEARLEQLYGDQQSFALHDVKPHGLEARISIPCEFEE